MWSVFLRFFVLAFVAIQIVSAQLPMPPLGGKRKNSRTSSKESALPTVLTRGMVRKFEDSLLIIEADDKRVVRIKVSRETKYHKAGKDASMDEVHQGDHLLVEAWQDEEGKFFAREVTIEKAATAAEKAAAPLDDGLLYPQLDQDAPRKKQTASVSSEDERPIIRKGKGSAKAEEKGGSSETGREGSGSASGRSPGNQPSEYGCVET